MGRGLCRNLKKIRHSFFHAHCLCWCSIMRSIKRWKHIGRSAAAFLAVSAGVVAANGEPSVTTRRTSQEASKSDAGSVRRTDANSELAHAALLNKAKQGRIDVYFVGDSITRRWGASDREYKDLLANWRENFFGWNAANFGWGGDTVQNILWRLENGELDDVDPKVIVILAGTNNVGTEPGDAAKVDEVARGIEAIIGACQDKAPDAVIILMAIFPRNDNMAVMPTINQVNERLAKLAHGKKVRFLNVNQKLADKDGKLFDGMMGDKLHPTVKGYQAWADGLKPILRELLGPPAKTDQAPPPSGNPASR